MQVQTHQLRAAAAGLPQITAAQHQHGQQQHQQYQAAAAAAAAPVQTAFVTPAMWQESVASVYEGGLKRAWDYDGGHGGHMAVKRH